MFVSLRIKHLFATSTLALVAFIGILLLLLSNAQRIEEKERRDEAQHLAWTAILLRSQLESYAERTRLFAQSSELDLFARSLGGEFGGMAYEDTVRTLFTLAEGDASILEVAYIDTEGFERVKILRDEVNFSLRVALSRELLQVPMTTYGMALPKPEVVMYSREGASSDGGGVFRLATQVPGGPVGDVLIVTMHESRALGTFLEAAVFSGTVLLDSDHADLTDRSLEAVTFGDVTVDMYHANEGDGMLLFTTPVPLGVGVEGSAIVLAKYTSRTDLLADYAFVRSIAIQTALFIAGVILVFNVAMYFLLHGMVVLYRTVREYQKGNLDVKISHIANDEVGIVATALNTLLETARNAEKDRKNFVQYATHQMRTPAAVMAKALDDVKKILVKKRYPKNVIDLIEDAEDQNRHTLRVSNTFLRYIELSGVYRIEDKEDVELYKLVKHVVRLHEDAISKFKLKVEVDVPRQLTVHCQRSGIVRAIEQVVSNAIHYSKKGGVVSIHTEQEGKIVTLSIEDHGIGIPHSEESQVFLGFYRATNAVSKFRSGSGLGLVIAKRIVKAHGGDVWFTSKEGEGTKFYISLPTS